MRRQEQGFPYVSDLENDVQIRQKSLWKWCNLELWAAACSLFSTGKMLFCSKTAFIDGIRQVYHSFTNATLQQCTKPNFRSFCRVQGSHSRPTIFQSKMHCPKKRQRVWKYFKSNKLRKAFVLVYINPENTLRSTNPDAFVMYLVQIVLKIFTAAFLPFNWKEPYIGNISFRGLWISSKPLWTCRPVWKFQHSGITHIIWIGRADWCCSSSDQIRRTAGELTCSSLEHKNCTLLVQVSMWRISCFQGQWEKWNLFPSNGSYFCAILES